MTAPAPLLAYGLGRSYGDTCLNEGGILIDTSGLDRFVSFDRGTGVLVCEAGVTLGDILLLCSRPTSDGVWWFLPATPGTKFVTVGGAIASDVHGKNHHRAGTFGRHVLWVELARSDGTVVRCSPQQNVDLYRATIGGLGLTGLITRAAVQLTRVSSPALEVEDLQMSGLAEFYELAAASSVDWEYTAAWIDCLATGRGLGRGIFTRARHARDGIGGDLIRQANGARLTMPADVPGWLLNSLTLRAFNAVYYRKLRGRKRTERLSAYEPVLYPLDAIEGWNRLYGRRGFFQYQCVVPVQGAAEATTELLTRIARAREGSFLVVLKTFGDLASPGLLSFPMEGTTLALDFPNRGHSTLQLLESLDDVVEQAGGRVYPAKDGRMSAARFHRFYPGVERFVSQLDASFSSSFWRRVQPHMAAAA